MADYLALGRDFNSKLTDVGTEAIPILELALQHHKETGDTIWVAAGFSPDFPHQTEPMSEMMARWLRTRGCADVKVLVSKYFNTYGELLAFYEACGGDGVIGFNWHLSRARKLAWWVGGRKWVRHLDWNVTVQSEKKWFDVFIEPLKHINACLPPSVQHLMVWGYKLLISNRTSY